jgi:hypothetical protein
MRKGWLIFILVLVIFGQALVLSSFHDVEVDSFANGTSVIAVAKWSYVQGSIYVTVMPMNVTVSENGTSQIESGPVGLVFPNGTRVEVGQSGYSFLYSLPRSGDFLGNGGVSGPIGLTEAAPMNVTISQNVQNATSYEDYLKSVMSSSILPFDLYVFEIYGNAEVYVSGFGVAL